MTEICVTLMYDSPRKFHIFPATYPVAGEGTDISATCAETFMTSHKSLKELASGVQIYGTFIRRWPKRLRNHPHLDHTV
jgi:hypothetical protein